MPDKKPYTNFLNPDATPTAGKGKKKKAFTVAQLQAMGKLATQSPEFDNLKRQLRAY